MAARRGPADSGLASTIEPFLPQSNAALNGLGKMGGLKVSRGYRKAIPLFLLIGVTVLVDAADLIMIIQQGSAILLASAALGMTLRVTLGFQVIRTHPSNPSTLTSRRGYLAFLTALGTAPAPFLAFAYAHRRILDQELHNWIPGVFGVLAALITAVVFLFPKFGSQLDSVSDRAWLASFVVGVATALAALAQHAYVLDAIVMAALGSCISFLIAFFPFVLIPAVVPGLPKAYGSLMTYLVLTAVGFIQFQTVNVIKHDRGYQVALFVKVWDIVSPIVKLAVDGCLGWRILYQTRQARDQLKGGFDWSTTTSARYPVYLAQAYHQTAFILGALVVQDVIFISRGILSVSIESWDREGHQRWNMFVLIIFLIISAFPILDILRTELPSHIRCPRFRECRQVLATFQGVRARDAFVAEYHRCRCVECTRLPPSYKLFGITLPSKMPRGWPARSSAVPYGWARFALNFTPPANVPGFWRHWNRSFHGTDQHALQGILQHRQLLVPGDTLLNGHTLGIKEGHIPSQNHIYTSPSLLYSALPIYASYIPWGPGRVAQLVLECRQQPESIQVQAGTLHPTMKAAFHDPDFDYSELEWRTVRRMAVVPVAVLVRVLPINELPSMSVQPATSSNQSDSNYGARG